MPDPRPEDNGNFPCQTTASDWLQFSSTPGGNCQVEVKERDRVTAMTLSPQQRRQLSYLLIMDLPDLVERTVLIPADATADDLPEGWEFPDV